MPGPSTAAASPMPADASRPTRAQLMTLREAVNLGYPSCLQRLLDQLEQERPECKPWLSPLRTFEQRFRFDRMTPMIEAALSARSAA